MNFWDSVKSLICLCERLDFTHLYEQRKPTFVQKLCNHLIGPVLIIVTLKENNVYCI